MPQVLGRRLSVPSVVPVGVLAVIRPARQPIYLALSIHDSPAVRPPRLELNPPGR